MHQEPSGEWIMAYTTIDNPTSFFDTTTWSTVDTSIDTLNFQPDWVWLKSRSNADTQVAFDSVRGANKRLAPSGNAVESTTSDELTAFNSDGFTLGTGDNVNRSSQTMVAWSWKAGTAFSNDASATGIGTIDSSGSTNQTAGFSIVGYTGNGSANQSVAHNLGGTPEMIIFKCRETVTDWITFHTKLGGANKNVSLNSTSATGTDTDYFANTNPTSTVFSVGAASNTNRGSEGMIAYCFRSIQGYSKIGSYTGNNSTTGVFVYTGFTPAFVLIKRTDSTGDWRIYDNKRFRAGGPSNKLNYLEPNTNDTEGTTDSGGSWDLLSNGFRFYTSEAEINAAGTYIYMAFAKNPFVTAGTKAAGTAT